MKVPVIALCLLAIAAYASATQVRQCKGRSIENLDQKISISNCQKPPCKLKKGTSVEFEMKFKAEKDVSRVTNTVYAEIVGVPFPFIGVDSTNACPQIFDTEGKQVGCPLKAGQDYIYRNKIDVLQIYPTLKTQVHWALSTTGEDLTCFEVPARITN